MSLGIRDRVEPVLGLSEQAQVGQQPQFVRLMPPILFH